MTKEQKIKEAYGDNYQKLCTYIDENGILIDPLTSKEVNEFLQENIDNFEWVDVDSYMPKSLYGIETNNGWEKYDYEKLPEDQDYHVITEDGVIVVLSSNVINSISKNSLANITHYKPIEKPKPPIY